MANSGLLEVFRFWNQGMRAAIQRVSGWDKGHPLSECFVGFVPPA